MRDKGFDTDYYSIVYYAALSFTMLNLIRVYSLWGFYDSLGPYLNLCSIILTTMVYVLALFRYTGKGLLYVLLASIFALIIGFNSEKLNFIWVSFVLVVGAKGVDFRNILKVYFIVSVCFCLLNVAGSLLGMTRHEISSVREGFWGEKVNRKSYGYGWPTDFANHLFFILLYFWFLMKGRLNILMCLFYVAIAIFIIFQTDTRLASGCIVIIVLFSFYVRHLNSRNKEPNQAIIWGAILSVPLFALISIIATISYDDSNLNWFVINLLLTNRLSHANNALADYGVSWFGQPTEFHGAIDTEIDTDYNFVDCSYMLYLFRYGIVAILIFVLIYCVIAYQASRRKDYVFLFAVFITGLSGVITQFIFDIKYCCLFLAFIASHNYCIKLRRKKISYDKL